MSERDEALNQIRAYKGFPGPVCRDLEGFHAYILSLMNEDPYCTYRDEVTGAIVAQIVRADAYVAMNVPTAFPQNNVQDVHIGLYIGLIKNPAGIQLDDFQEQYGHMNGIVAIGRELYCCEAYRGCFDLIRIVRPEHHVELLEQFTLLVSRVLADTIPDWSHFIEEMDNE